MKYYTLETCETLINTYIEAGGDLLTIKEGILGLGQILLHGATRKKSIVITERYLNSNSSAHTIRMYNNLPKKFSNMLNNQTAQTEKA